LTLGAGRRRLEEEGNEKGKKSGEKRGEKWEKKGSPLAKGFSMLNALNPIMELSSKRSIPTVGNLGGFSKMWNPRKKRMGRKKKKRKVNFGKNKNKIKNNGQFDFLFHFL